MVHYGTIDKMEDFLPVSILQAHLVSQALIYSR